MADGDIEILTDGDIGIFVDRGKRRLWVKLPVSLSKFDKGSLLMRTSREVCGDGAVSPLTVGAALDAFAICALGGTAEREAELGSKK